MQTTVTWLSDQQEDILSEDAEGVKKARRIYRHISKPQ